MTIYVSTSWEKNMISAHTCKEQAELQNEIQELEIRRDELAAKNRLQAQTLDKVVAERDMYKRTLQTLRANPIEHPDWPKYRAFIDQILNRADTK